MLAYVFVRDWGGVEEDRGSRFLTCGADLTQPGLADALTTWFGSPTAT